MEFRKNGCLLCGSELMYRNDQVMMECTVCHRTLSTNTVCRNGHFVCDSCHSRGASVLISGFCMNSVSKDPIEILLGLMNLPGVHMHGPEHHVMVGSAILTAYRNCGGDIDLGRSLEEMRKRAEQVPGGVCGMWGACGAAVSCGIALSIITGTSPLSEESWGLCNRMTSECLDAISRIGGPRCCKRDGFTAVLTASAFIRKHLGVKMETSRRVTCTFSDLNAQCLKRKCPYHE